MGALNEEAVGLSLPSTHAFVKLQLLDGGSFTASTGKLHAGVKDEEFRMYNWAFYVHNPATKSHVLWDLGMTSVLELLSLVDKRCTNFWSHVPAG